MSEKFDIVIDTLQKKHDILWKLTQQNINSELGMNIMDDIRFEQMDQLQKAIDMWKARK